MSSTWTTEEIQKMNEMISMKKSFGKIAKELGRTQLAVKYKFGRQYRKENKVATPETPETPETSEMQDISHVENMADNIYINNKDILNYVNTIGSIVIISCIGIVVYGTRVYVQIFLDSIQKIRQF